MGRNYRQLHQDSHKDYAVKHNETRDCRKPGLEGPVRVHQWDDRVCIPRYNRYTSLRDRRDEDSIAVSPAYWIPDK